MVPAMLAWMALLASATDPYFARLAGGSVLMLMFVIVKFGKSAGTVDLSNFKKKVFFFKKKCFVFSKKTFFLREGHKRGPCDPEP